SGQFPTEPWLYTGGLLGAVVVAVGATVVRLTGVLLLMLGTISGQLLGALAVDLVAPTATPPTWVTCAGAGVALLAVLITLRPSGPRRGAVRKGGPRWPPLRTSIGSPAPCREPPRGWSGTGCGSGWGGSSTPPCLRTRPSWGWGFRRRSGRRPSPRSRTSFCRPLRRICATAGSGSGWPWWTRWSCGSC